MEITSLGLRARVAAAALVALLVPRTAASQRSTLPLDGGWRFHLGDVAGAQEAAFDDSGWRTLDLPHDWSIEGEFSEQHPAGDAGGALPGGVGWYRKTFSVAGRDTSRLVFVEFDGVYRNSEVWINGHYLGKRPYGYSSFRYGLAPYLRYGQASNVIAVRVDNSQQPNSRWYSGSGIYRHVRLVTTDPVHVDHWGTYVTTPEVTAASARVTIRTTIRNASQADQPITLRTVLYDAAGKEVAAASSDGGVRRDSVTEIAQNLVVRNPTLWSLERPYRYRVVSRVHCRRGRPCDDYGTLFGVRTLSFDADRGFVLNGTRLKIRGVCLHHDLGALGSAVNTRALERQLQIMKEMGVNAIRTSHNPPAPELLDLADRMGFIVMDEAFDMWKKGKTKYDYHLDWDGWHVRDLSDMVRRDRNHPSVFIWSIGNEVVEQWNNDTSGITIARELAGIVRALDPTRPITSASNNVDPSNPLFRSGALDLLGFKYHHDTWADFPKKFPGQRFIATETTSALNTRGYYDQPSDSVAFHDGPWAQDRGPPPNQNYRISAYDHRRAGWGSLHEDPWREIKQHDYLSGMFVWTGMDYLGEPTPYDWPARSSYFGIVDLAGFPKDPFYMYQSEWTGRPVLHVFPHWNWKPGATIDVWAYSNADEVELFLNGASLGVKRKEDDVFHLMWRVAYAPGTVRAVARKGAQVVATREVKTAGAPARLALVPDRATIRADGEDLSFVTVNLLDRAGVAEPTADHLVRLRLRGDARIVGVDNGDQISHAPLKADRVQLFNGKALVIVRAGERAGTATLTAEAEGVEPASVRLDLVARR
jgi:beta-galactosidase